MGGHLLTMRANLTCPHAGKNQNATANAMVTVKGEHLLLAADVYTVTGCTYPSMTSGAPPCVSLLWTKKASKVTVQGVPVLLTDGKAKCLPNPDNVIIAEPQLKVTGK